MKFSHGGYVKKDADNVFRLDNWDCIYSNMTPEIAKALGFIQTLELEKMNTPKQISVVITTKVSDDKSANQKVGEALANLYSITYNELTDDIWQAIKLLQNSQRQS